MSARFNLEALNLPTELDEKILKQLSNQLIHYARTNPQRLALIDEFNERIHLTNNLPTYKNVIIDLHKYYMSIIN